jgi:hypothetical protein
MPIIIEKLAAGERRSIVDRKSLNKYFGMNDNELNRLTKFFSIPGRIEPQRKPDQLDRRTLASRYKDLIDQGYFRNKADLARHLGVSRAWITKVMNELKQGGCN